MTALLEAALWLADHGKPVFPIYETDKLGICSCAKRDCPSAGKHPRTPSGFHDATCDLDQINRWWKRWPDANIGMPTGPASGVYVMDIDSKTAQGREVIRHIKRDAGLLVEGCMVETPGKPPDYVSGLHVYIWSDADVSTRSIGVGELKGAGGYVLVPPSARAGRAYRFLTPRRRYTVDDPLAWVTVILASFGIEVPKETPGPSLGSGWAAEWLRTPRLPDTRRAPDGLPRMVGYLRGHGIDCETAIAIIELWDAQNPVPLGPSEVRKHVAGMFDRYGHPDGAASTFEYRRGQVVPT